MATDEDTLHALFGGGPTSSGDCASTWELQISCMLENGGRSNELVDAARASQEAGEDGQVENLLIELGLS